MPPISRLLLATLLLSATALQGDCEVVRKHTTLELRSPFFTFSFSTGVGNDRILRAETVENLSTGRKIEMNGTSELRIVVAGEKREPLGVDLKVVSPPSELGPGIDRARFEVASEDAKFHGEVVFQINPESPLLHKQTRITNSSGREVRLLDVYLGEYFPNIPASGRERGFPAYLGEEVFLTVAHPAGWATAEEKHVTLAQHPGVLLQPGETFECMEVVFGFAREEGARKEFLDHVRSRMRRVVRGHDRPYAIYEPFGGRPGGDFDQTEDYLLANLEKVLEGKDHYRFDFYSVDFWVDYGGDLIRFDPERYPHGFSRIKEKIAELGTEPGFWIDSSMEIWSIGGNPEVQSTLTHDPEGPKPEGRIYFCRATEPIKSMYETAFRHHIRENGARMLKFDNFWVECNNPHHDHLPGVYSIEPIVQAQIDFLKALDEENPEVFLMLYWGHRSPWWLVHADTLFDSGVGIEAAHPSDSPAPFARDSVTQKLDQAQEYAQDIPKLGKDSLGVWLSDWGWNSSIGKERWQEAFVMDLCRGSLLAQVWTDTDWLSEPERQQIGEFIDLLKARPECFGNPRPILGSPQEEGAYGYSCSDGGRAFLAIDNYSWEETIIPLCLDSRWGLSEKGDWKVYRWYPHPVELEFASELTILLRPFEVVLLEVVPRGEAPSLDRKFPVEEVTTQLEESSQSLHLTVESLISEDPESATFTLRGNVPATEKRGLLVVTGKRFNGADPSPFKNVGYVTAGSGSLSGEPAIWTPIFGEWTYPSCWQGWRIPLETSTEARPFELLVKVPSGEGVEWNFEAHFLVGLEESGKDREGAGLEGHPVTSGSP